MTRILLILLLLCAGLRGETMRVVAANLTSGSHQTYSPDNANHSNPEGAGARVLKGLRPDIVLIQEFQTTIPVRQWVNATFGEEFAFVRGEGSGLPNGVISRWPIIDSGEWDDPYLDNRGFVWARIGLPDGTKLLAVSVHLFAQKPRIRGLEAEELVARIAGELRAGERLVIGGDLNVRDLSEAALRVLSATVQIPSVLPADGAGNPMTNSPRNRPYDWVLVDPKTQASCVPVEIGGAKWEGGLVFDSRAYEPLSDVPPVQRGDSAAPQMQHMAVVRDFRLR